jgi:hypothetical protein
MDRGRLSTGQPMERSECSLTNHIDVYIISRMELTVSQVAAKLGVTPGRVHHLIQQGRIKARYLTPRMMLIDARELAKLKILKPGRPPAKKR